MVVANYISTTGADVSTGANTHHVNRTTRPSDAGDMANKVAVSPSPSGRRRTPPPIKFTHFSPDQQRHSSAELLEHCALFPECPAPGLGGVGAGRPRPSSCVLKDKMELKASIKSLKDNNEALHDINKELEHKLFQVSKPELCVCE